MCNQRDLSNIENKRLEALSSVKNILTYIGEDIEREGLIDTPHRILRSFDELYGGYKQEAENILKTSFKDGTCEEMVILKDIEFYSTCEHHMLPFFGSCHVGYLPNKKVVGVSKLARLVDCFARRMQIQERLTTQIAESIEKILDPKGVFIIMEAQHFCMTSRGVRKQRSKMVTSAIRGYFKKHEVRAEFLEMIK